MYQPSSEMLGKRAAEANRPVDLPEIISSDEGGRRSTYISTNP